MVSNNNTHIQNTANAIGSKISADVTAHNSSNTAHSDIRNSLSDKLNADDVTSVEVTINYLDGTSETVELLTYVQSS